MKKSRKPEPADDDDGMLPEYDFSKGARNKHVIDPKKGYTVNVMTGNYTRLVRRHVYWDVNLLGPKLLKLFPDVLALKRYLEAATKKFPPALRQKPLAKRARAAKSPASPKRRQPSSPTGR